MLPAASGWLTWRTHLDDILVDSDSLRSFSAALLVAVGVSEEDAAIAADVLVTADLTGHESHGVARLEGQ